jgi:hypothetical protein
MEREVVEAERMRIWDFYFVFPAETAKISIPRDLWTLKRTDFPQNPYEELIDSKMIFERMRPFQMAAYRHLAALGLIQSAQLLENKIVRTAQPIPNDLLQRMGRVDDEHQHVLRLIASPLNDLKLYGVNGLKYRTKLLDFRYDAP